MENERNHLSSASETKISVGAYHRFYTDMKWGYAENYHICLNNGELGIEKCVEIISGLY